MSATSQPDTPRSETRLLTSQFLAVCTASTCYFFAYGIVTPVLPHYVVHNLHGGNFWVGIVAGCFAVSAIVTRPSAGRIGNNLGRRWLMIAGGLFAGISIASYGLARNIPMLVAFRLITGIGEGFFYTGSATVVNDLAPVDRRGEAISYYSVTIWLAVGLGPALGQIVYKSAGPRAAFLLAALFSVIGSLFAIRVPKGIVALEVGREHPPLVQKKALIPGSVLALSTAGGVAFNAYVPLYIVHFHIGGPQYVFLLYAAVVLSVRIFFARLPDRWGPQRTGTAATICMALGFLIVSVLDNPLGLYLGTVVLAMGNSLIFPALLSMAVQGVDASERASIIGTFTAFFDIASGLGGITLGAAAALSGYRAAFGGGAVYAFAALVLLRAKVTRTPRPQRVRA